tara:strand:- start:75 stop:998 length:924 start_codon:yes stop_codon:yes gene_type:complete
MAGSTSGVNVFTEASTGGTSLSASYLNGIFGDGSDGDAVIATGSPVLISRDMMYNNLTVPNGATLTPRGFRIFVKGVLTIDSTGNINDNGKDAVGINPGLALNIVSTGFGAASGAGASGRTTTGAGAASITSSNCSINDLNQTPQGGVGGSAGGANTGGAAGAAPAPTILQKWTSLASMWTARCYNASSTFNGGSGGGAGGCDATGGLATSGGGGGAAGIVWIAAKTIVNNGSITCNGGAGGNGVSALGVAGGGGGGAGGMIAVITATNTGIGLVSSNGGTPGTSVGTGATQPTAAKVGNVGVIILS